MKIALLWSSKDCGLYSNSDFDLLNKQIGMNNGNLAFVYAISHQIEGEIDFFPWHTSPEKLNTYDFIVFPGANQLGKHTDLGSIAGTLAKVTKPVIVIGLGAQAKGFDADIELTEGTANWLEVLIENGKRNGIRNIYTRGPYTTEQIYKLTGVKTLANGCPSHFINARPDLGRRVERNWKKNPLPQRIAVAGGHESWENTRVIEQQLVALMMDPMFPGVYIVQSMDNMIKLSRGLFDDIPDSSFDLLRNHIAPHYSKEQFSSWALNYARSYYDVASWMDELRRYDLLIGPRFHGAQLAIQAERMGCTITIDTRTEEMCRETGVPFLRAEDLAMPLTRSHLKELIKFDSESYDALRAARCARYVEFLKAAGLRPSKHLVEISNA
ncbi:polysaccharide pyruvyl transferase family protein [Paracoccus sp. TOH]|uniref:polysaccharide pyruvyl transferase family protein n=1 Tax=Paracoccus sp. TOH TaxID=1263728 RepID=UPI0025AFD9FA|nr:polysaccharide pyruvyl transferase family protein [Paracoccus sp. TOH]WJS86013.1 polysaccharide pyruvyl transferase family protein [Paracoccus sp. TOH]